MSGTGDLGVATTDGGVDTLARLLAVELALGLAVGRKPFGRVLLEREFRSK